MRQRERLAEAKRRGTTAGENAASWVFDGNTTDQTYKAVAKMMDEGDPRIDSTVSAPEWLSGEYAGESISELLGDLLWDKGELTYDADQEIEEAYTEAADSAFWAEVERAAHSHA